MMLIPFSAFVESSLAYPHERQDILALSRSGIRRAVAFFEHTGQTTHTSSMNSASRRFPSRNLFLFPDIRNICAMVFSETLKTSFGNGHAFRRTIK